MADEKDLEIARLQGRLEAAEARRGGAGVGTLKVVGTLLALVLAVVAVLAILGNTIAKPKPLSEQMAECARQNAGYEKLTVDCKARVVAREMERRR